MEKEHEKKNPVELIKMAQIPEKKTEGNLLATSWVWGEIRLLDPPHSK